MANPTIQGTPTTVIFGVGSVITAGLTSGRVTKVEYDPTTKFVELLDDNGIPTGRFVVPQTVKGKFTAEMDSSVTPATLDTSANYTVGGVAMYLDKNPKKNWTRGAIAEWEFDLSAFPS